MEGCKYKNDKSFISKFTGEVVISRYLSTGSKTVLNIKNFPEKCFYTVECGANAEQFIFDNIVDGNIILNYYTVAKIKEGQEYSINNIVVSTNKEFRRIMHEFADN